MFLVVRETSSPHTEYIVPIDLMTATIADTIQLRCSKAELEKMDLFIKAKFIEEKVPNNNFVYGMGKNGMGSYYYLPYVSAERTIYEAVEHQQIPLGELTVHRGTHVEATDGYVGKVDKFVVNPKTASLRIW